MFIAGSLIIVAFSACQKEKFAPVPPIPVTGPPAPQPIILNMVADHWVNYGGEVYSNTFHNVLTYAQLSAHTPVHVYMETTSGEQPLSNTPVMFDGHNLWITTSATDITLNYQCLDQHIPFNSLNIKIVIG